MTEAEHRDAIATVSAYRKAACDVMRDYIDTHPCHAEWRAMRLRQWRRFHRIAMDARRKLDTSKARGAA